MLLNILELLVGVPVRLFTIRRKLDTNDNLFSERSFSECFIDFIDDCLKDSSGFTCGELFKAVKKVLMFLFSCLFRLIPKLIYFRDSYL